MDSIHKYRAKDKSDGKGGMLPSANFTPAAVSFPKSGEY